MFDNLQVSTFYKKYFVKGNVDYLGRVNRFSKQNEVEIINRSYIEFCQLKGIKLPFGYRKIFSNMDASFRSISKYDKSQPDLNNGAWMLAGEWTKTHFFPMCGSVVLTEDIVLGEMDLTTSCGYPASLHFPRKSDLLGGMAVGTIGCSTLTSSILSDYWDVIGTDNEDNIVPIWTCSQKIEMRAIEKVKANKIRTFTASPIEHSCATNRLCLDMNNKFYAMSGASWSFVGGTKYLQGWDKLYHRLNKHKNAFELDESEYDSSLFSRALYGQRDIRWSFLAEEHQTPENKKRMDAVYQAIVHSVIVLETGELVQKHTGNPSGSSNTIVDNTMILFRLFAYAWIILCNTNRVKPNYSYFMSNVEAALNGDDNTFTVSDVCVSWFNPDTISPIWSSIGVTTNTPCSTPRLLRDVCFLSQGFRYDKSCGIWLPVPETQRVLSSLCFGSPIDDIRFHLLRANALRLDSYGNEECRSIIRQYIEYVQNVYIKDLVGDVNVSGTKIPMTEIYALWKSDLYIEALYSGKEALSVVEQKLSSLSL
jgi:hypothetical protein